MEVVKLSAEEASKGIFTLWVTELGITWLTVSLLCVAPAILYGSAFFSVCILAGTVLIGVPSVLFGIAINRVKRRALRCLAIMLSLPLLTLIYVSHVDQQIPKNASPLTQAIETFRNDTGHYPESLEALTPNYLQKLPNLRLSVFDPPINYRIKDGIPYLAIPSAMGDMFAQFEFNFETKVWEHQS